MLERTSQALRNGTLVAYPLRICEGSAIHHCQPLRESRLYQAFQILARPSSISEPPQTTQLMFYEICLMIVRSSSKFGTSKICLDALEIAT